MAGFEQEAGGGRKRGAEWRRGPEKGTGGGAGRAVNAVVGPGRGTGGRIAREGAAHGGLKWVTSTREGFARRASDGPRLGRGGRAHDRHAILESSPRGVRTLHSSTLRLLFRFSVRATTRSASPCARASCSRPWPLLPPRSDSVACVFVACRRRFVSCRSAPFPCRLARDGGHPRFLRHHHSPQDFCSSPACTGAGSVPLCDAVWAFTSDSFGEDPRFHWVLYHDDAPVSA